MSTLYYPIMLFTGFALWFSLHEIQPEHRKVKPSLVFLFIIPWVVDLAIPVMLIGTALSFRSAMKAAELGKRGSDKSNQLIGIGLVASIMLWLGWTRWLSGINDHLYLAAVGYYFFTLYKAVTALRGTSAAVDPKESKLSNFIDLFEGKASKVKRSALEKPQVGAAEDHSVPVEAQVPAEPSDFSDSSTPFDESSFFDTSTPFETPTSAEPPIVQRPTSAELSAPAEPPLVQRPTSAEPSAPAEPLSAAPPGRSERSTPFEASSSFEASRPFEESRPFEASRPLEAGVTERPIPSEPSPPSLGWGAGPTSIGTRARSGDEVAEILQRFVELRAGGMLSTSEIEQGVSGALGAPGSLGVNQDLETFMTPILELRERGILSQDEIEQVRDYFGDLS